MKIHSSALALVALFLSAVTAFATINPVLQMQTGNPSAAATDPVVNRTNFLIQRAQYAFGYNDTTREPNWVAWNLTSGDVGSSGRSPDYFQDTTLPAGFYQVLPTDYSGSGYDRGHLCPSGDRTVTRADNDVVFFMSNMMPQAPDNNQGVWASFETYCRTLADAGNEILIIAGPGGFAGSTIASGVSIPGFTWKIAVVVPLGAGTALSRITATTRVIAIKIPNTAGVRSNPWQQYVTSTAQLQTDTGYTFFTDPALAGVAAALRAQVDGQTATGAPTITTQPSAQTSAVAGSASFSVTATSNPASTLTYQWLKNDDAITGNTSATTATLTLTNVQAADAAIYTVVVTNSIGSVTSAGAALVITGLPPVVATPPASITKAAGTTAVFTVSATGSPTLAYQWRKGGTNLTNTANITGATTATLTVANVQASDIATYDVVISNGTLPNATSAGAALTVAPAAPTIATSPTNQNAVIGGGTTFTIVATGSAPFTYQWRKGSTAITDGASGNGSTFSGATSATLALANTQLADAGTFDVVVTNAVGTATSTPAVSLTVSAATAAPLVISGFMANPAGTDSPYEYVQLVATQPINFATTPYSVVFLNNGTAGANGWILGGATTYGITINTGSVAKGDVVYVGGSGKLINGVATTDISGATWLQAVNTSTAGSGFGSGSSSGVLGNGGTNADGIGVFNAAATALTAANVPVDAVFYGTAIGSAKPATGGYTVPSNDRYANSQGTLGNGTNTFLFADTTAAGSGFARLTGTYNTSTNTWTTPRTLSAVALTATSDLSAIASAITVTAATGPTAPVITGTSPGAAATGVNGASPITVTFDQSVTVANGWFTITSAQIGGIAATVTGGPTTYTLTPPVSFTDNDTVTVTFVAAQITDTATSTLHPAANT
ncbi:MAG: hypothetical protein RLZZ162_4278, partial [Verrucomicrobiota bacterium]